MSHTIEEFVEGAWTPIEVFASTEEFNSRDIAEASLGIKRALRKYYVHPLRIVQTSTPD